MNNMEFPPLAGWPTEYPDADPSRSIFIVYADLLDLKKNIHLPSSSSWLSKLAQNLLELDLDLEQKSPSFNAFELLKIQNWIKYAKEKGVSLHDALYEAKNQDFKEMKLLKSFFLELAEHDQMGLDQLLKDCHKFLQKKNLLH